MLGALAIGAVFLAVYERRKGKYIVIDDVADLHRDPARAAFSKAEAIRAEASSANPPQAGGFF